MSKGKKSRTQYNWKFKENEKEEFYEWFENQDNIASSLRNVIYHMIELYGTNDFLDPGFQRKLAQDYWILSSARGKNIIQVNSQLINSTNIIKPKEEDKPKPTVPKEEDEPKPTVPKEEDKPKPTHKRVNYKQEVRLDNI